MHERKAEFLKIGKELGEHIASCTVCVMDSEGEFITMCSIATQVNRKAIELLREVVSHEDL